MIQNARDLRTARNALGYSLQELADELMLMGANSASYLREMEEDRREISGPIRVAVDGMLACAGFGIGQDGTLYRRLET